MRTPPLLADFIHSRACKPICAKSLTLPNSTAGTPIFLSVACSVVNALTTYFNQAKTSRKAKQNRPFQLKRAVFVELLPRFELGTSSLPTDWENEISCVRTLLCPFPSGDPCSPSLLSPLFPPARFPVWVSVWVSKVVPLKISTTISKAPCFTHKRFFSVFNCSRRGAGTLGSNF